MSLSDRSREFVGWVEWSETHRTHAVGLAPLDPPYKTGHPYRVCVSEDRIDHDDMDLPRPMHPGDQAQLDVAGLARTSDQRQRRRQAFPVRPQVGLEQVEQV